METKTLKNFLFASAALLVTFPAWAADEDETAPDLIVVTGTRTTPVELGKEAEEELATGPDGAAFVARLPGMALVDNGTLSGQVQMRGLFGERIRYQQPGFRKTGGPNAMDPAMTMHRWR